MNYEKAYKEALEKIREGLQPLPDGTKISGATRAFLEEVFPELQESEDERIRKALVRFHKSTIDVDGIKGEDILAWLEKQDKQKSKWSDEDANTLKAIIYTVKNSGYNYCIGVSNEEMVAWLEKQGERKITHEEICKSYGIPNIGEFSDGYHTFNGLYKQRMILFAVLVKTYKDKAWKSWKHEDGLDCFGGGWFIVGIDTPAGTYTYHYEAKDWDRFDCKVLEKAKHWDGHDEFDVERLFTLVGNYDENEVIKCLINGMKFYYEDNEEAMWGTEKFSMKVKDILSWLEKQKSVGEIVERCKNSWYNEGKIAGMAEGLTDDEKYQQGWHDALEKQGKQKVSVDDFKAKNWYVSEVDGKIHDMTYNPTDKDEPKFKVGDWIIRSAEGFKHNTYLITEVKDYYVCEELKGRRVTFTFDDVRKNFKLWTIQDAKDGDVLIDKSHVGECVFIFKEARPSDIKTDVNNPLAIIGYCGINHIGFTSQLSGLGFGDTVNCTYYPASKEQRDLLFQKMKEAGYQWNPDTKKLKKVEQKPTWSDEDKMMLNELIIGFYGYKDQYPNFWKLRTDEIIEWLKKKKNEHTTDNG